MGNSLYDHFENGKCGHDDHCHHHNHCGYDIPHEHRWSYHPEKEHHLHRWHFDTPPCPPGMPKDMYERFVNKMARHLMKQEEYAKAGTALFDGFVEESIRVEAVASTVDTGRVLYSKKDKCFVYQVENRYYIDWRTMPAYNDEHFKIRKDKVYVYNGWVYHYSADQKDLVKYMEVGGDDDREILYKLDEEEKQSIIDASYDKIAEKVETNKELEEIALNNKIDARVSDAVIRKLNAMKVDATIEYSETSSLNAEYDSETNKIHFDLRLPFKELMQYVYGVLKAVIQFEGIDRFPQDGGTFKYNAFVARTKTLIVNGELSEDVEFEIIDDAHVVVSMDESANEFAWIDIEKKEIHIEPNETGEHREIVFFTDYGGNEGKHELVKHVFEQCQ